MSAIRESWRDKCKKKERRHEREERKKEANKGKAERHKVMNFKLGITIPVSNYL